MNKKLIGNLFLLALVITLGLSFIDFGKKAKSDEEIISHFIADNLEEATLYQPKIFKRIDESFLMSQPDINKAYTSFIDSVGRQLSLLGDETISLDLQNSLESASSHAQKFSLESLYHYLPLDAQMKRLLKKADPLSEEKQKALYAEETRMHQAFNEINKALSRYSLSLFSLDLSEGNPRYWHEYELSDDRGTSLHEVVFELEKGSQEVVSFKEI